MKEVSVSKQYVESLVIPAYLVQGVGDQGLARWECDDGNVEQGDLRVTVELSSCVILLPGNSRLVLKENGDLAVELLIDC